MTFLRLCKTACILRLYFCIRLLLKEFLAPLGFDIIEAVDGYDTLNKALEFHPDLILLDLIMPEMDGFEVVQHIRQRPTLHDVIVIAISAKAFQETRQESIAAGCDDFIAKPINLKEFSGVGSSPASSVTCRWQPQQPPKATETVVLVSARS